MTNTFDTPFKTNLKLQRYPYNKKDLLQAWDAADELILKHLSGQDLKIKRILILNDQYGALSCALEGFEITSYTDSYLSYKCIQLNSLDRVKPVSQLNNLVGTYDY